MEPKRQTTDPKIDPMNSEAFKIHVPKTTIQPKMIMPIELNPTVEKSQFRTVQRQPERTQ